MVLRDGEFFPDGPGGSEATLRCPGHDVAAIPNNVMSPPCLRAIYRLLPFFFPPRFSRHFSKRGWWGFSLTHFLVFG